MRHTLIKSFLASQTKSHALHSGRLFISASLIALAPAVLADIVIDPFSEGNIAVQQHDGVGYDGNQQPAFGDFLVDDGSIYYFTGATQGFYIGLPTPTSRGRVFLDGPGTVGYADGGLIGAGDGSVLSITNGARVLSHYGVFMRDSVEGSGIAKVVVSGRDSLLSDQGGEYTTGGTLKVDSGVGEASVLVSEGGRISIDGRSPQPWDDWHALIDISATFEVSGTGSTIETDHVFHLRSGTGESARVINGGRILQTEDIGNTIERPIAFSYSGGTSEDTGLLVSGFGSRIDLVNDALFTESAYVTLRDGASLTTQGSVFIEGDSAGATQMVLDDARIAAAKTVIDSGAAVSTRNQSLISGDVALAGGQLTVETKGLNIAGDLNVGSGVLALEIDQSPALAVEGTTLFGPNSFIRLLLSAVPSGDILVNDYLLADAIEFAPQFSLAAQLDVQFSDDVDLRNGADFSVRFAGLDQSVTYRYSNAISAPEIDGAGLPLAFGLLALMYAIRRERKQH